MTLRPSNLPKLAICACFELTGERDDKSAGTLNRDDACIGNARNASTGKEAIMIASAGAS